MSPSMSRVLFVCVHNTGRSQMAEAFFNALAPADMFALSAGTQPGTDLNPVALEAMKEAGIDMTALGQRPKELTAAMVAGSARMITMGCQVDSSACPANFFATEDWGLADPNGQPLEKVREIRDQIKLKVQALVKEMSSGH